MAGITKATRIPVNGIIVRDPKTGEPTGHLKESATRLIADVLPKVTDDDRRAALSAAVAEANGSASPASRTPGGSVDEMALFDAARKAGDLTVRAYLATRGAAGITEADVDAMDAAWKQYGDDPTVRTGIVKMFADGVIESKTAAMLAPYAGTKSAGAPNMTAAEMNRIVAMFDKRGWQVQIHAIGDRAIRMSLDAFEAAAKVESGAGARTPSSPGTHRGDRRGRHRAVRRARRDRVAAADSRGAGRRESGRAEGAVAGCDRPRARVARLGVEEHSGRRRAPRLRQRLAGGHARSRPGHLAGVHAREGREGRGPAPRRSARRLRATRSWAAYASFDEQRKGTLAPGMLADIVVLASDITAAPIGSPTGVVVAATIFDGKVVYEKK